MKAQGEKSPSREISPGSGIIIAWLEGLDQYRRRDPMTPPPPLRKALIIRKPMLAKMHRPKMTRPTPSAMNLLLLLDEDLLSLSLSPPDGLGLSDPELPPPGAGGGFVGGLFGGGLTPPPPPPKPPPPPLPKPRLRPLTYVVPQQVTEAGGVAPRPTSRLHLGHCQMFSNNGPPPIPGRPVKLPLNDPPEIFPLIDPPEILPVMFPRPEMEPLNDPPLMFPPEIFPRPEMEPLNDPPEIPRPEMDPPLIPPLIPPRMPRWAWTGRAANKATGKARITAEIVPRGIAPFIGVPLTK